MNEVRVDNLFSEVLKWLSLVTIGIFLSWNVHALQWNTVLTMEGNYSELSDDPIASMRNVCSEYALSGDSIVNVVSDDTPKNLKLLAEGFYQGVCYIGYIRDDGEFNGMSETKVNSFAQVCEPGHILELTDAGTYLCQKYCPPGTEGPNCIPAIEERNDCGASSHPISFSSGNKLRMESLIRSTVSDLLAIDLLHDNRKNSLFGGSGYIHKVTSSVNDVTNILVSSHSPYTAFESLRSGFLGFESYTFNEEYEAGASKYVGGMNRNWRLSFEYFLQVGPSKVFVGMMDGHTLFAPNGEVINFTPLGVGSSSEYLLSNSDSFEYVLHAPTYSIYFDDEGRPQRMSTSELDYIEFSYNDNKITSIRHNGGDEIFISYVSNQPYLITYGDVAVNIDWVFTELGGILSEVDLQNYWYLSSSSSYPLTSKITYSSAVGDINKIRRFEYSDTRFPTSITAIYDYDPLVGEEEQLYAEFRYDDDGRAVYSSLRDGIDEVQVAYPDDDTRVVTNALGRDTTYTFDSVEGVRRLIDITGAAGQNCQLQNTSFTYHSNGRKATAIKEGIVTSYPDSDTSGATIEAVGTDVEKKKYIVKDTADALRRPKSIKYEEKTEHFGYQNGKMIEYRVEPQGWAQ